jgi:hypothetical protein
MDNEILDGNEIAMGDFEECAFARVAGRPPSAALTGREKSMFRSWRWGFALALAGLAGSLWSTSALGTPMSYRVVPLQSRLAISGQWNGANLALRGNRGLDTIYNGAVNADLNWPQITLTGSGLDAKVSGKYTPVPGSYGQYEKADYAGQFTNIPGIQGSLNVAIRNLVLEVSSSPLELKNGNFDASGITVTAVQGELDYAGVGAVKNLVGKGSVPITASIQNAAGSGSLTFANYVQTLTIPINVTWDLELKPGQTTSYDHMSLTVDGLIVAAARATPAMLLPEPATLWLLLAGLVGLRIRRKYTA